MRVMLANGLPRRSVKPFLIHFFGAFAQAGLFLVATKGRQRSAIEHQLVIVGDVAPPAPSGKIALGVADGDQFLQARRGQRVLS